MKSFEVPVIYRSPLITAIKQKRKADDRMKKDFSPTLLDFGPAQVFLARHFGFCYGVEHAIEIAFRTIEENPGRRIFLLSEMIHNPFVNEDLLSRGVKFLMDTKGHVLIPFSDLTAEDIVLIPAFGTTLEIEKDLRAIGLTLEQYDTTCPFVEKVWNRSEQIAEKGYTVVVHGKPSHEETRATFSHSAAFSPTLVVNDMAETLELSAFLRGERPLREFHAAFEGRLSAGFDPERDLQRIGVVNQTTMLASDTQAIADVLRQVMVEKYGLDTIADHFADTRDTLCYATNDNQSAAVGLLEQEADLALVVGGRNSSNTSHLVELCENKLTTYFVRSEEDILPSGDILHFDWRNKTEHLTRGFLPEHRPLRVLVTSGASCPDAIVEAVVRKMLSLIPGTGTMEEMTTRWR
jgi:4-hydroxy-3-methylbut-2-en-1-yl diphosphate reductase